MTGVVFVDSNRGCGYAFHGLNLIVIICACISVLIIQVIAKLISHCVDFKI